MITGRKVKHIALIMEATRTSKTFVNCYQTTRSYNPKDSHLHDDIIFIISDLLSLRSKITYS